MIERKYSYAEIDLMRRCLIKICEFEFGMWQNNNVRADAEERLRTHLQAGTDPQEIRGAVKQAEIDWQERQKP